MVDPNWSGDREAKEKFLKFMEANGVLDQARKPVEIETSGRAFGQTSWQVTRERRIKLSAFSFYRFLILDSHNILARAFDSGSLGAWRAVCLLGLAALAFVRFQQLSHLVDVVFDPSRNLLFNQLFDFARHCFSPEIQKEKTVVFDNSGDSRISLNASKALFWKRICSD